MGIPKFFVHISERYPCVNEQVKELQTPEFDNFYVDMNGIIHACTHPVDSDLYFVMKEEQMFASILHYIEVIFNMIKPKKLLFLAVDGVAPRAKINQQRSRRFRSAKEFELKQKNLISQGKKPIPEERFDPNTITPGTIFMEQLHSQLQYFVASKISTDPLWQGCKVILSGHQTPGEGEHKIMEYIRYLRSLPDYNPNTRHCLYGLDSDLIILGLSTHEPYFCLLREKVKFGQIKKKISVDKQEFWFLHLSIMREYLDLEFQELKEHLQFDYNLENIIDDWVLMTFLVGNDFIPSLPNLYVNKKAFPVLFKAYKEVLPKLEGYLNENGYLNLPRFEKYMESLKEYDMKMFEETYADLAYLEEKTGRNSEKEEDFHPKSDLEDLIRFTNEMFPECKEESLDTENDTFTMEFFQHKQDYYTKKLDYIKVTNEVMKSQAEGYIRAIQWNLHYYYQGCQSWSWYYPHHYSPFISDITNFKDLKLNFELGKPFSPFEQLLSVLPAASKNLLPKPYWDLMTSPDSPIIDFYPEDFETDLNGKQQEWEAVVLIPFIEEKRLLEAMKPANCNLSHDEIKRNQHKPMSVYTYTEENLGYYKPSEFFPAVYENHALETKVTLEEIIVEKSKIKYGLLPGVSLDIHYPQFLSLKHIPFKATLKNVRVKVFDFASKEETMVLSLQEKKSPLLKELGNSLLGKIVYVNWPHLFEANKVSRWSLSKPNISVAEDAVYLGVFLWSDSNVIGFRPIGVDYFYQSITSSNLGRRMLMEGANSYHFKVPILKRVLAVADGETEYSITKEGQIKNGKMSKVAQFQWLGSRQSMTEFYLNRLGIEIGSTDVIIYVAAFEGWKCSFENTTQIKNEKFWSSTVTPCPIQVIVKDIIIDDHHSCQSYLNFQKAFPVNSVVFMLGQPYFGSMGKVLDSSECARNGRLKVAMELMSDPPVNINLLKSQSKVVYLPCRIAALQIGISPFLLSRITGCILIQMSNNSQASRKKGSLVNIGLNLKFKKKNEELPGYTKKKNDTWLYSNKAVDLVGEYVKTFSEVVEYLSNNSNDDCFLMQEIFPGSVGIEKVKKIVDWLKAQEYNKIERVKCGTELLESETIKEIEKIVDSFNCKPIKKIMLVKPKLLYKNDLVYGNLPPVKNVRHQLLDRVVSVKPFSIPIGLRGFIIGIHQATDEADYCYDVLFDKPFFGGTAINSSPQRACKLSRASFVNISDANRVCQRKLVPSLLIKPPPKSPHKESKKSAFVQCNQQGPKSSNVYKDEDFQKMWCDFQKLKPQEGTSALKKILKVGEKNGEDKKPEAEIKDSVKSFFENVIKVTNSKLTSSDCKRMFEEGVDQSGNKYYSQSFFSNQRQKLPHPKFNESYLPDKSTQSHVQEGKVHAGLCCESKCKASESVTPTGSDALKKFSHNNEAFKQNSKERKIKENQIKLTNALSKEFNPKDSPTKTRVSATQPRPTQHNYTRINNTSEFLPNPPSEWTGSGKHYKIQNVFYSGHQENDSSIGVLKAKIQNPTSNSFKKVPTSSLEFVPLQAIIRKRNLGNVPTTQTPAVTVSGRHSDSDKKIEIVTGIFKPSTSSSTFLKPKRRPKIAANLDLDLNLN